MDKNRPLVNRLDGGPFNGNVNAKASGTVAIFANLIINQSVIAELTGDDDMLGKLTRHDVF